MNNGGLTEVDKYVEADADKGVPEEDLSEYVKKLQKSLDAVRGLKSSRHYKAYLQTVVKPEREQLSRVLKTSRDTLDLIRAQGSLLENEYLTNLDALEQSLMVRISKAKLLNVNEDYGN